MATITIPQTDTGLGIPAQSSDTIPKLLEPLILSMHPATLTQSFAVAASQTIVANTVVGLDAAGRIVKATPTTGIVGVIVDAITTDASTNYKGALVYTNGHFNTARLTWDATFDTEAKKQIALGAKSGILKFGVIATFTPPAP